MKFFTLPVLLLSVCLLVACAGGATPVADTVLTNGKIYTLNAEQPWAEAVVITDGRYRYVGSVEQAARYIGPQTEVIDLAGKMAMPGINDAHIHPLRGGIKSLYECNFPFTATPDQIAQTVTDCVAKNPDALWIRGGQWDSGFFDNYRLVSPRKFLDAVSGDKAVLLNDDSNHNGWANSKALELAGITRDTPDPEDGVYVRDPVTGEPNGLLLEGAEQALYDSLPDWSAQQYRQGALEAVRLAHRFGITGMKDASANEQALATYQDLDRQGKFKLHMAAAIHTPYGHRDQPLDYKHIDQLRDRYRSAHVDTGFVKIFLDGVPTDSRTAAMLSPYTDAGSGNRDNWGLLHLTEELLNRDVTELDRRGYTVKIHTAGDRSVQVALNAIAAARRANGDSDRYHELAHAGYIDAQDFPRFATLKAVADLSPYLWYPSPIIDSVVNAVGRPRGEHYWPISSLLEHKAPILAGSDWPAAVPSMDPWVGIEAMVTRRDPRGKSPGSFWSEQAISLAQALRIYTLDGARALQLESETGSVEVDKSAELIVLNQNLFEVAPGQISETQVELTLFEGEPVYRRSQ